MVEFMQTLHKQGFHEIVIAGCSLCRKVAQAGAVADAVYQLYSLIGNGVVVTGYALSQSKDYVGETVNNKVVRRN